MEDDLLEIWSDGEVPDTAVVVEPLPEYQAGLMRLLKLDVGTENS